jgi:decaprenylphospho-beta-D-ribofuranose 2-oxidase
MRLENQTLPPRIFGVLSQVGCTILCGPFMINLGAWGINTAKYIAALRKHTFRQSHAAFHFLLDYVPNWELSYGRGGLIQYQSFLPKETAEATWREMIGLSQKRGLPSYLGVTKRHRPDTFLLSHAVDGFSLAMDFKVTDSATRIVESDVAEFDANGH